jgi:hypothetical protein
MVGLSHEGTVTTIRQEASLVKTRRLALTAAAAVSIALAVPGTALAAAGTDTAPEGLASASSPVGSSGTVPTFNRAKATCHDVASGSGVTARCTQTQRLPLKDLTAAQRAQRSKDMSQIRSHPLRSGPSAQLAVTAPPQCEFSSTEYAQTGISHPDRFTSCSDNLWVATNWEVISTPPFVILQGIFFWEDQQWESYSASSPDWAHGMITLGYTGGAGGNLSEGVSGDMYSGCFLAQGICGATSLGIPDPQPVSIAPGGTYPFEWAEFDTGPSSTGPGADNILDNYLGVNWDITNTAQPTFAQDTGYLAGRCDSQVKITDGCVDEAFTPTVIYDATLNPLVSPVAQHIFTAQSTLSVAWGVPSYVRSNGQVLNRDTSSADITANNRAACASVVLLPGQNCDEFPLASTFQGAAFQPVFSAVAVPASANSSQGGITSTFYTGNRVVDDDPFYVLAILANGTPSW